jgi:hypothetical protein
MKTSNVALVIILFICTTLGACATTSDQVYKLYSGPEKDDAELATLQFGSRVHELRIDGMSVRRSDYGSIKIAPGRHKIQFGAEFGVSVMVNPDGFDSVQSTEYVDLEAGHTYSVEFNRSYGHGYQTYLWVQDLESGENVAGARKP